MVWAMLYRQALIFNGGAPFYIHYYNRAAALPCTASGVAVVSGIGGGAALDGMPSSVAQSVYRRFVYLLYCCTLEWLKLTETPLQSPVNAFGVRAV